MIHTACCSFNSSIEDGWASRGIELSISIRPGLDYYWLVEDKLSTENLTSDKTKTRLNKFCSNPPTQRSDYPAVVFFTLTQKKTWSLLTTGLYFELKSACS